MTDTGEPPLPASLPAEADRDFERGDFHAAAARARATLARSDASEDERAAARAMLARLRADPLITAVFVAAALLFALVAIGWLGR